MPTNVLPTVSFIRWAACPFPDNAIMALAEDYLSRRQYGLRFRNLETGNWYPEMLDNVSPISSGVTIQKRSTTLKACLNAAALSGLASYGGDRFRRR